LQQQHLPFIKNNKKLLMVYIECKYFFNLSLNNRVVVIYFRYSGKEDHNWLPLYVIDLCPIVVENNCKWSSFLERVLWLCKSVFFVKCDEKVHPKYTKFAGCCRRRPRLHRTHPARRPLPGLMVNTRKMYYCLSSAVYSIWTEYKITLASVRCPSSRRLLPRLWAQFWTDLHQIGTQLSLNIPKKIFCEQSMKWAWSGSPDPLNFWALNANSMSICCAIHHLLDAKQWYTRWGTWQWKMIEQ